MSLKNILSRRLVTCEPSTSIHEMAKLMRDREVGALLVVDGKKPVGIITDRDLVLRGLAENRQLPTLSASDIMSEAVETVSEDAGIYELTEKMRKAWIRRVVVVDRQGEAIGLVSFDDIFELITDEMIALQEVTRPREPKFMRQTG